MTPQEIIDSLVLERSDCDYCDIRIEDTRRTLIVYRNFELESANSEPSLGALLRVLKGGRWFVRSTTNVRGLAAELDTLAQTAQVATGKTKDYSIPVKALDETHIRYADIDPSRIDIERKFALCTNLFPVLREFAQIKSSTVMYGDKYKVKYFRSSRGVRYSYDTCKTAWRASFTLRDGDKVAEDSYDRFSVDFADLAGGEAELRQEIQETKRFLHAPVVKAGKLPVVLDPEVTGVFAHESFGHKSEADFMLGDPKASEAWKIGSKVAAECVSLVDEGQTADITGYAPIDDEGMPSQKTYLIKDGVLQGRLHSLETAHHFQEEPTGNARAISFEFEPIVRMTNTYIEPGELSFEELIAPVKEGIYVKGYRHGSGLSTFTIAPRKAYWIRDGKIAEPVRVSVISGTVFQTLKDIEACSKDTGTHNASFGGCGKFDQAPLDVAHGGPAIRVKSMQVS